MKKMLSLLLASAMLLSLLAACGGAPAAQTNQIGRASCRERVLSHV